MSKTLGTTVRGDKGTLTAVKGAATYVLGYTRGGDFDDGYKVRHIKFDGALGDTKGDADFDSGNPTLKFKFIQCAKDDYLNAYAGMTAIASPPSGYTGLEREIDIPTSEYFDTLTWEGKDKSGKNFKLEMTNVLLEGNLKMSFEDKNDIVYEATYIANFTDQTDTKLPYKLLFQT